MFLRLADWIVEILGIVENPDRCNKPKKENSEPEKTRVKETEIKKC